MLSDLIIYQKLYDAILYVFPILNKFPKNQRFVLAQQIQNTLLNAVQLIAEANLQRDKRKTLFQLDVELDKARLLIRLAHDLNLLSHKQYGQMAEKLSEVGRLLGGWRKQQARVR